MVEYNLTGGYHNLSNEINSLRESGAHSVLGEGYLGLFHSSYFGVEQYILGNKKRGRSENLSEDESFYDKAVNVKDSVKQLLDYSKTGKPEKTSRTYKDDLKGYGTKLNKMVNIVREKISDFYCETKNFIKSEVERGGETGVYAEKTLEKLETQYKQFYSRFEKDLKKSPLDRTESMYMKISSRTAHDAVSNILQILKEQVHKNRDNFHLAAGYIRARKIAHDVYKKPVEQVVQQVVDSSVEALSSRVLQRGNGSVPKAIDKIKAATDEFRISRSMKKSNGAKAVLNFDESEIYRN